MTQFLRCSNPLLVCSYNMRYDKSIAVIEDVFVYRFKGVRNLKSGIYFG